MRVERRFFKGAEVRAVPASEGTTTPKLEGYGAVFNEEYVPYEDPGFKIVETIAQGAFTGCLSDDVRCLFNHDADNVLGRSVNDTLKMSQDSNGLFFVNTMDMETRIGKDVYQFVRRGDVTGCSFAFIVQKATWTEEELPSGQTVYTRTIEVIGQLFDVGPVTYPAYEQTSVDAREMRQAEIFADMPEDMRGRLDKLKARTEPEPVPASAEVKAAQAKTAELRGQV